MTTPVGLALTILADGQVLMELLVDWYHVLAIEVAHVEDGSVAEVVQRWAADLPSQSRRRAEARGSMGREFGAGYLVTVNDRHPSGEDHDLHASHWGRLLEVVTGRALHEVTARTARTLDSDLSMLLRRCRRLALDRDANGTYRAVLEQYVERLSSYRSIEDQHIHQQLEQTIGTILRREQYLLLAADAQLRNLYLQVRREMSELYQWSMDLDRGGVSRQR